MMKGRKHRKSLLFLSTCVIVAMLAVAGETFIEEGASLEGLMLAGIPSSFDLRVLPAYKPVDFTST